MNFIFPTPQLDCCAVKLWATGRYGFSLPKKVDITTPAGATVSFLYYNRRMRLKAELANRAIVRIAIAQFLAGDHAPGAVLELDPDLEPYAGPLTPTRANVPRAPLRVRPGPKHGRIKAELDCEAA